MKAALASILVVALFFGPTEITQSTEGGLFGVTMVIKDKKLVQGHNPVEFRLAGPGGSPVEGATITITPWMPKMNHGVWSTPKVFDKGGGRYRATVFLSMGGHWEIRLTIGKDGAEDKVVFDFPDVKGK